MRPYENERRNIADALAQFMGSSMHFLHRGAFQLPDGGTCIFGNDSAIECQRAAEEWKSIQDEAKEQTEGDDIYTSECNGTWVVVTYDTDYDAEEWRQIVWNTWFAICDAQQGGAECL
jgi:hypothetical protein